MKERRELYTAIDALGATSFSLSAFRHTSPGRDSLSGTGARLFGGRWNPQSGASTVYLAEPLESCIAEFLRMADGQGKGAASFLPRDVHTIELDGVELVDLRTESALDSVGLTLADIASEDWEPCQVVGAAIELLGYGGLCAPSATGRGLVLALSEHRIDPQRVTVTLTRQLSDYV